MHNPYPQPQRFNGPQIGAYQPQNRQPSPMHYHNQPMRLPLSNNQYGYPPPQTHRSDIQNNFHAATYGIQHSTPVRQNYHISGPVNRQAINISSNSGDPRNSRTHSLSPMPNSGVNFHYQIYSQAHQKQSQMLPHPSPPIMNMPPPPPQHFPQPQQIQHNPPLPAQQSFPQPVQMMQHTIITKTQIIWQQKFIQIYSFFQVFVQKFEIIWEQLFTIQGQFDTVNDEQTWNDLRSRYNDITGMFSEVRQQIISVLQENKKTIQNINPETVKNMEQRMQRQQQGQQKINSGRKSEGQNHQYPRDTEDQRQDEHTWQHRFYQLMQQYQTMTQQAEAMKQALENQGYQGSNNMDQNLRQEYQNRLHILQEQNSALRENQNKLNQAYNMAVAHIQEKQAQGWGQQTNKMVQQLQMHIKDLQQKNQALLEQINTDNSQNVNSQQYEQLSDKYKKLEMQLKEYSSAYYEKQEQIEMHKKTARRLQERLNNQNQEGGLSNAEMQNYENMRMEYEEEIKKKKSIIRNMEQNMKEQANIMEEKDNFIKELQETREYLEKEKYQLQEQCEKLKKIIQELEYEYERLEKRFKEFVDMDTHGHQHEEQQVASKKNMIVQLERTIIDKDRKIRSLQAEVQELNQQIFKGLEDRQKYIKEIKEFFSLQSEGQKNLLQEKDVKIKSLQDQLKSFQHELSSKNLEISRFRHQNQTKIPSPEENKRFLQAIQKKNHQIHQLKRNLQTKSLNLREQQQKVQKIQQQLKYKTIQINQFRREAFEIGNLKNQVEQLHAIIKKKNGELNEIRQQVLQKQKAQMTISSLQREKVKLNEHLKEQARQCENKNNQIFILQKKINSLTAQASSFTQGGQRISPVSFGDNSNSEYIIKQKDNEIKRLRNEKQILDTTITTNQKSIRDLTTQVNNLKQTNSVLKADNTNKIDRVQSQLHQLSRSLKKITHEKEELENDLLSAKNKINILENSRDQKGVSVEKQLFSLRERVRAAEEASTNMAIDNQLSANTINKLQRQKQVMTKRIKELQDKLEEKKKNLQEARKKYSQKQKEQYKASQEKIKNLDNELKLNNLKITKLEESIENLTNKVKSVQQEKKSYKQRLLMAEGSLQSQFQPINFRKLSEQALIKQNYLQSQMYSQQESASPLETDPNFLTILNNNNVFQLEHFSLKDAEANNVFQRKVIYQLKKQNDHLRSQLISLGISSPRSANKMENANQQLSIYQQELLTERSKIEENNDVIGYYKQKNKELQNRIDELLKMNMELKSRVANLTATSTNQLSLQFYKDQIIKLEQQIEQYKAKIKPLMLENINLKEQLGEYQSQCDALKSKNEESEKKLIEFKDKVRNLEAELQNLENGRVNSRNQIQRLKQSLIKERENKKDASKIEKNYSEEKKKNSELSEQYTKIMNKNSIMKSQIQRLQEKVKQKQFEVYLQKQKREQDVNALQLKVKNLEGSKPGSSKGHSEQNYNTYYNYQVVRAGNMGLSHGGPIRRNSKGDEDQFSMNSSEIVNEIKERFRN